MINKLIQQKKLEIYFQPIVSIKDTKIFAFEALTRAFDDNGSIISPLFLFDQAIQEGSANILDSYVRILALEKFTKYHKKDKNILLFLNFESSFIESDQYHTFIDDVKKFNINPSSIVLEIKEDEIQDNNAIKKFVNLYRKNEFIIAIDDFGTGYSGFDRLSLIKPDIVKIDKSIMYNIDKNFINSEILRAVSNMCHKIGALVLAEGVEKKEEILNAMSKDIDIFQGFYFSKPLPTIDLSSKNSLFTEIHNIGIGYKKEVSKRIHKKKKVVLKAEKLSHIIETIYNKHKKNYKKKIQELLIPHKALEAIYMIEFNTGLQKDNTIINIEQNTLFNPTKEYHDHSLKEYYFVAKNSSQSNYLSGKYISKASGNMCRTYSSIVKIHNKKYILCLDIKNS